MSAEDLPNNVIPFPGPRHDARPSAEGSAPEPMTFVSAQIRGWSAVAEALGEDGAAIALRVAVEAALETLGAHGGTKLSVEGVPGQPDLDATFAGPGGARHAVTAAAGLRSSIARAQAPEAPEHQFRVGTGLDTGPVGSGATPDGVPYLTTGALRASATRLRDFAGPGQIFLTDTTLSHLDRMVTVQPLGPVRIDPAGESREAFSLTTIDE